MTTPSDIIDGQVEGEFLDLYASSNISTCLNPFGIGIPLQTSARWNATGCGLGFLCKNNTSTNPPEYCPPTPRCLISRLARQSCTDNNGIGQPQGFYEPVVCDPGYYCPSGGKLKLPCPKNFFCPRGSYRPTPCHLGALCPERSVSQISYIPFVLLVAVDSVLVLITLWVAIASRYRRHRRKHRKSLSPKEHLNEFPPEEEAVDADADADAHNDSGEKIAVMVDAHTHGYSDLELYIQSLSKIEATEVGISFGFENLGYSPKNGAKRILSNVSGLIGRGSFWGVMGASGAGKSTFLNVLRGKFEPTCGVISLNGVPKAVRRYKKIIGFVPQDDIVQPALSVRENILHAARIRLPSRWSDKEIRTHVDDLISCLQLSQVQHSIVGDATSPIISGGQRKRVSIGVELAAAPMALFLDEPTSGLDATAAASIMVLLKALSRMGVTVITIIHQPRAEIFKSLDMLLWLANGREVFQGRAADAQGYFECLGFTFPQQCNPADIISDITAGHGQKYHQMPGKSGVPMLLNQWEARRSQYEKNTRQLMWKPKAAEMKALYRSVRSRGASWPKQVYLCMFRSLLQQVRHWMSFYLEIFVAGVAGLLIGLSANNDRGELFRGMLVSPYEVLSSAFDYASLPELGLLSGIAIGLAGSAPGVKIFGEEKLEYWREASSGHSRSAYYVGKVLSTVFRLCLATLHFTVFFGLLATPLMEFHTMYLANLLYFYTIYGLSSIIAMITRREDGPLLAVITSLIIAVFCGTSPSLAQVKGWHMAWFWRMCPGTWYTEAIFNANLQPLRHLYKIESAAASQGFTLGQFPVDMAMLFAIGTAYRIIAFCGLILIKRSKQR